MILITDYLSCYLQAKSEAIIPKHLKLGSYDLWGINQINTRQNKPQMKRKEKKKILPSPPSTPILTFSTSLSSTKVTERNLLDLLLSMLWPLTCCTCLWRKILRNFVSARCLRGRRWCAFVYRRPPRHKQVSSGMRFCRSVYLFTCLPSYLSLYSLICLSICLSVYLLTNLLKYLPLCLSTH